jgi:apolipoprotein N-acyltransferase
MKADNPTEWMPATYGARFFNWLEAQGSLGIPALSLLMGGLLSRAFAPSNFFPALFIALPVFLLLINQAKKSRDVFARGWWAGFGLFTFGLYWMGHAFTQQDNVPVFLAPFALFALGAVLALYMGATFWITWRLRLSGVLQVLAFAASWTIMEVARGTWFTGFPWHLVGSAWANWTYMAQGSYWFSVYGLSFITVFAAGLLALFISERERFRALVAAGFAAFLMLTLLAAGYFRVADQPTEFHLGTSLKLVQANVKQRDKWKSNLVADHFDSHMRLSRAEAGKAEGTKLLIWPETAVQRQTFDRKDSLLRWRISRLLAYNSYAITGAPRYTVDGSDVRYYNSLFVVNSKGKIYSRYDKNHLVPFGEYLPFAPLLKSLGLSQLTGGVSFTPGVERPLMRLPGVPGFKPLICYESIFPGEIVGDGPRPEWLLNISNDAWFGETEGPHQHLALARLRAIEEGLPIVRSTSTGISAVIDGYGRTVTSLGLNQQGVLESPLPKALPAPFVPTGVRILAVVFLCAGIILFFLLQLIRIERAEKA